MNRPGSIRHIVNRLSPRPSRAAAYQPVRPPLARPSLVRQWSRSAPETNEPSSASTHGSASTAAERSNSVASASSAHRSEIEAHLAAPMRLPPHLTAGRSRQSVVNVRRILDRNERTHAHREREADVRPNHRRRPRWVVRVSSKGRRGANEPASSAVPPRTSWR